MPKVLIIDDEKAIRNALRDILQFENFEVEEAADGAEGMSASKMRAAAVQSDFNSFRTGMLELFLIETAKNLWMILETLC